MTYHDYQQVGQNESYKQHRLVRGFKEPRFCRDRRPGLSGVDSRCAGLPAVASELLVPRHLAGATRTCVAGVS